MIDIPTLLAKAAALLGLNRPTEAEPILGEILSAEPEHPRALQLLALALMKQTRFADALGVINRAIAADPTDDCGHRVASEVLRSLGQPDEAARAAEEAVRLAPHLWQTHYTLSLALRMNPDQARAALARAQEAIRLAPHESEAHNLAGLCFADLKMNGDAIRAYQEALRLDPENAFAINNLAAGQLDSGSLASAGDMLRTGLAIAPQTVALQQNYDLLLLKLIGRLFIALLVLGAALFVMALAGTDYLVRAATAATLLLTYLGATYLVTRTLPRGAHLWARGLLGRVSPRQALSIATFGVLSLAVLVVGFAPVRLAIHGGEALVRLLQLLGFIGLIATLAARLKNRR